MPFQALIAVARPAVPYAALPGVAAAFLPGSLVWMQAVNRASTY